MNAKYDMAIVDDNPNDADIQTAYNMGVDIYVVKTVDYNNYEEMVNHLGLYWLGVNEYS